MESALIQSIVTNYWHPIIRKILILDEMDNVMNYCLYYDIYILPIDIFSMNLLASYRPSGFFRDGFVSRFGDNIGRIIFHRENVSLNVKKNAKNK